MRSTKRIHTNPATNCVCTRCGTVAHSIPGKLHRHCLEYTRDVKGRFISKKKNVKGKWKVPEDK